VIGRFVIVAAVARGACGADSYDCPDPGPPIPLQSGVFNGAPTRSNGGAPTGSRERYDSIDKRVEVDLDNARVTIRFEDPPGVSRVEVYRITQRSPGRP